MHPRMPPMRYSEIMGWVLDIEQFTCVGLLGLSGETQENWPWLSGVVWFGDSPFFHAGGFCAEETTDKLTF